MPSLPSISIALLVATLLASSHPALANNPNQGPPAAKGRAILAAPEPYPRTREFLLTKVDGKWHTDACKDP